MPQSGFFFTYAIVLIILFALAVIVACIIYTVRSKRKSKYTCFIAGATSLSSERDAIRAVVSEVNNQKKRTSLSAYTFEDFPTSVVTQGPQEKYYNKFLRHSTDIAVFIIDGEIGKETSKEFDVAFEAFKASGRPTIYVYCKEGGESHKQANELKERLKSIQHYWTPYINIPSLKHEFKEALNHYLDSKTGDINTYDDTSKKRNALKSLLFACVLMIISIPIARHYTGTSTNTPDNPAVVNTDTDTPTPQKKKIKISVKSKAIEELKVKDDLISKGCLTIEHSAPVKYHITSEDPSTFKIDWDNVESTLDPGSIIYPKSNSHIYLHAEDGTKILEKVIEFNFYEFVEFSIKQENSAVLEDMFLSLTEIDDASYILNDSVTESLTRGSAQVLFKNIKELGYKITHIEFQEEPNITSNKYPKIKLVKCSKNH